MAKPAAIRRESIDGVYVCDRPQTKEFRRAYVKKNSYAPPLRGYRLIPLAPSAGNVNDADRLVLVNGVRCQENFVLGVIRFIDGS